MLSTKQEEESFASRKVSVITEPKSLRETPSFFSRLWHTCKHQLQFVRYVKNYLNTRIDLKCFVLFQDINLFFFCTTYSYRAIANSERLVSLLKLFEKNVWNYWRNPQVLDFQGKRKASSHCYLLQFQNLPPRQFYFRLSVMARLFVVGDFFFNSERNFHDRVKPWLMSMIIDNRESWIRKAMKVKTVCWLCQWSLLSQCSRGDYELGILLIRSNDRTLVPAMHAW